MAAQSEALSDIAGGLVLVGCGKMGGALLQGWLGRGLDPSRITVIEPQPQADVVALTARGLRLNPPQPPADPAAIVLAIKPQTAAEAMAGLAPGRNAVVISIMAGKPLAFLEAHLPAAAAAVRAMPNTPAAIGRGITVAVANANVGAGQHDLAHALLAAIGTVEWVADEALMDAVTAVSGSGPAYVFLLAEAMAQAATAAGLPPALAATLARETVAGSGELLRRAGLDPAILRQNVTSPGGTTAAALAVLMGPQGLPQLMAEAVMAATRRSRELAG